MLADCPQQGRLYVGTGITDQAVASQSISLKVPCRSESLFAGDRLGHKDCSRDTLVCLVAADEAGRTMLRLTRKLQLCEYIIWMLTDCCPAIEFENLAPGPVLTGNVRKERLVDLVDSSRNARRVSGGCRCSRRCGLLNVRHLTYL